MHSLLIFVRFFIPHSGWTVSMWWTQCCEFCEVCTPMLANYNIGWCYFLIPKRRKGLLAKNPGGKVNSQAGPLLSLCIYPLPLREHSFLVLSCYLLLYDAMHNKLPWHFQQEWLDLFLSCWIFRWRQNGYLLLRVIYKIFDTDWLLFGIYQKRRTVFVSFVILLVIYILVMTDS